MQSLRLDAALQKSSLDNADMLANVISISQSQNEQSSTERSMKEVGSPSHSSYTNDTEILHAISTNNVTQQLFSVTIHCQQLECGYTARKLLFDLSQVSP